MTKTGDRNDPFPAFRFELQIDDLPVGGFSECTGIQLETETEDYQEGGANDFIHKFPTRLKQSNLTLKRGIVGRQLWEWYFQICQGTINLKNGSIIVYDLSGRTKVMVWRFRHAFPVKFIGPELNAIQNNIAVETLELCHEGLELES
jgi:phage tail-like protein